MLCRWTLTSTLLFTHLQFMSSHYTTNPHPAAWPLLPCREGEMDLKEEQKEEEKSLWANAHLLSDLHMELINKRQSLTGFWHHWRTCFELISEELMVRVKHCNDAINCASFSLLIKLSWKLEKQVLGWYIFVPYNIVHLTLLLTPHISTYFSEHNLSLTSNPD